MGIIQVHILCAMIVRTQSGHLHDADAGNGVANAGKPAAAKPNKPSGPAAKRGGSKTAAKDQRGIMSFFAKK